MKNVNFCPGIIFYPNSIKRAPNFSFSNGAFIFNFMGHMLGEEELKLLKNKIISNFCMMLKLWNQV